MTQILIQVANNPDAPDTLSEMLLRHDVLVPFLQFRNVPLITVESEYQLKDAVLVVLNPQYLSSKEDCWLTPEEKEECCVMVIVLKLLPTDEDGMYELKRHVVQFKRHNFQDPQTELAHSIRQHCVFESIASVFVANGWNTFNDIVVLMHHVPFLRHVAMSPDVLSTDDSDEIVQFCKKHQSMISCQSPFFRWERPEGECFTPWTFLQADIMSIANRISLPRQQFCIELLKNTPIYNQFFGHKLFEVNVMRFVADFSRFQSFSQSQF